MKNSPDKHISSFNNPEYKFLISLKKNRNRKSEMKSIAEGYRENKQLIDSKFDIDTHLNRHSIVSFSLEHQYGST